MAQNLIQLITTATVNRADGTVTIVGRPTAREDGTTTPEIFGAQVAADPLIADGVEGAEGQLIMNTTGTATPATLDADGELTITPEQEDANLYTRGDADDAYLLWSDEQTDGGVPVETSDIKLVVQLNPIVSGRVTLATFEIDATGVAETVEWRVSEDGVFWTEWAVLTEASVSGRTWAVENSLLIQLRLTPASDSVVFRSVTFVGTWSGASVSLPTLDTSVLAGGWATEEARTLERNIFLKLYRRGIIPTYIRRGDNDSYDEDRDYVDLWFSVARFAALFIVYFRRWERWWTDIDLLQETLDAYGLYYQRGNSDLETLQYLVSHLLDQARVRGTEGIFHRTENGYEVDGEFIHLLQNAVCDELLYENIPNWRVGWVMSQSSPLYRGTARAWALNKTGENSEDFVDPSNYLITHTANVPAEIIDIEDAAGIRRGVLRVSCGDWSTADDAPETATPNSRGVSPLAVEESITVTPASLSYKAQGGTQPVVIAVTSADTGWSVGYNPETDEQGGLGRQQTSDVANPLMVADSELDYEITFRFCILTGAANMTLSFGVEGFSKTQRLLTDAFCAPSRAHVENTFVERGCEDVFQKEEWYYVRGIIHAYGSRRGRNGQIPNIGIGTDLYFNNYFVKYILPKIQFVFTGAGAVDIWDYKVRPLVRGRNIIPLQTGAEDSNSLGFVQSPNWSHTYARNNSSVMSPAQIANIIESTLYTFDRTNLITLTGYYE